MAYEIPLYRPRLLSEFSEWVNKYKDDPLRADAYERAERVKKVLESIEPVTDDSPVPGESVLREFIGGSTIDIE